MNLINKVEYDGRMEYLGFVGEFHYFEFWDCSEYKYNYVAKKFEGEIYHSFIKTQNGIDFTEFVYDEFKTLSKEVPNIKTMANGDTFFVNAENNIIKVEKDVDIPILYESTTPEVLGKYEKIFSNEIKVDEEIVLLRFSIDGINFYDIPTDALLYSFVCDSEHFYCKKADTDLYYRIKVSEFDKGIKIIYNNCYLSFENPPVIENDRTLIPMRFLFEQMGADVSWDETTNTATVSKASDVVSFSIDNLTATVNAQPKTMDVPARLINDKTYIPLRFLSEELGYTVEWDEEANTVIITE